mgnify:CR=1 FL=1
MMKRKSQAALEFLMTYGWAILVVLVAIGALAYFGVLSPDKFLPAKCTLQSGIVCLDHKATATTLEIVIQNSLGFDIRVDSVKAGKCTPYSPAGGITVANGGRLSLIELANDLDCLGIPAGATKFNEEINVTYTITETGIQHNNRGQITTRIE